MFAPVAGPGATVVVATTVKNTLVFCWIGVDVHVTKYLQSSSLPLLLNMVAPNSGSGTAASGCGGPASGLHGGPSFTQLLVWQSAWLVICVIIVPLGAVQWVSCMPNNGPPGGRVELLQLTMTKPAPATSAPA